MLSRRKDPLDERGKKTSKTSGSHQDSKASSSKSSSSGNSQTSLTKGEKRKSNDDPHDEKGSEYLRRKHNFIKSTIRVDYQPDICKDFKETGFCGFGDSCKFLHDRSDYKHGWQLEQEWAKGQHRDNDDGKYLSQDSDEEKDNKDDDANLCIICKQPYKDPIVTKCKHNFCDTCAEKECSDKCYICQKPTSGIFKTAKIDSQTKSSKP